MLKENITKKQLNNSDNERHSFGFYDLRGN